MRQELVVRYGGEDMKISEVARLEGVCANTVRKWQRSGDLSPEWVAAYKRERELHAMARERGIPLKAAWKRINNLGWDVERAYTEPLHTIHEPKRWRKPG